MSKRRQPGDIVWKSEGAGFTGQAELCVIPVGSEPDDCMMGCDDPECREWPDLWPCDESGMPTGGNCCHVAECEISDRPNRVMDIKPAIPGLRQIVKDADYFRNRLFVTTPGTTGHTRARNCLRVCLCKMIALEQHGRFLKWMEISIPKGIEESFLGTLSSEKKGDVMTKVVLGKVMAISRGKLLPEEYRACLLKPKNFEPGRHMLVSVEQPFKEGRWGAAGGPWRLITFLQTTQDTIALDFGQEWFARGIDVIRDRLSHFLDQKCGPLGAEKMSDICRDAEKEQAFNLAVASLKREDFAQLGEIVEEKAPKRASLSPRP